MTETLVARFLKYIKFDTRSDASSTSVPSTPSQAEFAKTILWPDLESVGLTNIHYNEANGFLTAELPANTDAEIPTIGFIAHIDTADFESANIQPQMITNYEGEDILLNEEQNIFLRPSEFPNLKNYIGQTLITTDGTTLLGSDDKSGIAEIVTAIEKIKADPSIKHGTIKVAFGPDEEIGRGADLFDVESFGADFAYTMDGGPVGELQYESFHAAQSEVIIRGKNVHPGTAKDTMVNAQKIAFEFDALLPANEVPERTEGREGFFHLLFMEGTVEDVSMTYIIRDHDRSKFEEKKQMIQEVAAKLNEQCGVERVKVTTHDQYYNMGEILEKDKRPVDLAEAAMNKLGITPIIEPIRGGTDGSKLTFMGLPTPNVFAGGENFHGRYEFVAVESMEKATDVIVEIVRESSIQNG